MYCIDSLINNDPCLKFSNISIVFYYAILLLHSIYSFLSRPTSHLSIFNSSIFCPTNYTHSLSVHTSIVSNVAQVIILPEYINSPYSISYFTTYC